MSGHPWLRVDRRSIEVHFEVKVVPLAAPGIADGTQWRPLSYGLPDRDERQGRHVGVERFYGRAPMVPWLTIT